MSKIADLVFQHFSELEPLDCLLIAFFTLILAFAFFRFLRYVFREVIEAKDEVLAPRRSGCA